ncbi:MAG: metallophosphoesterase [Oscillospiraceae bacterium]|nr:metallophosphoesterase [Oscillospiraceae bacterium]
MGKSVLTFIADTHHYSRTLGDSGKAFVFRSDSDQKCLKETGAIIDAAFDYLSGTDCDAVCIAGDLSNDGEKVSHEEFREKLYRLKEKKKVYVITATHDWCCDKNPRKFIGDSVSNDVPILDHNDIYEFYKDFGVNDAFAEYKTTLGPASYAVNVGEHITLLGLIDDKNGRNSAGYKKAHLDWICEQIKSAIHNGRVPVAMEHHLLIPHITPLFTKGGCSPDREMIINRLADAGLKVILVGHSHLQRIDRHITPNGNEIYEINIGSLVGYPAPMVTVTADDKKITVSTDYLKSFTFDGETLDAQTYLQNHSKKIISVLFSAAAQNDKELFRARLEALGINTEKLGIAFMPLFFTFRKFSCMTVREAGRYINKIPFTKKIPEKSIDALAEYTVQQTAEKVWLNILDGAREKYTPDTDFYKVVAGVFSVPVSICKQMNMGGKALELFTELQRAIDEILTGGELSNENITLYRSE